MDAAARAEREAAASAALANPSEALAIDEVSLSPEPGAGGRSGGGADGGLSGRPPLPTGSRPQVIPATNMGRALDKPLPSTTSSSDAELLNVALSDGDGNGDTGASGDSRERLDSGAAGSDSAVSESATPEAAAATEDVVPSSTGADDFGSNRRVQTGARPLRTVPPPMPLLAPAVLSAGDAAPHVWWNRPCKTVRHIPTETCDPGPTQDCELAWKLQDFWEMVENWDCCRQETVKVFHFDPHRPDGIGRSDSDDDEEEDEDSSEKDDGDGSGVAGTSAPAGMLRHTAGPDTLVFDSDFESGNLQSATRVFNRLCPHRRHAAAQEEMGLQHVDLTVDQEYDLRARYDIHTKGNVQWFYFRVSNAKRGWRVRFNLVNNNKSDSLFNYGMLPLVYSERDAKRLSRGWRRGGDNVCYFQSAEAAPKKRRRRRAYLYKATWTYTFQNANDVVYFAYSYPYTYTDLQDFIRSIEEREACRTFFRRKLLCHTLAGNMCDVITITASTSDPRELRRRKGVVITARVHPGETNASFMMQGLLRFLTGNSSAAKLLRANLVFKIVPMLNPDGVIHGNYRCSLAGVDLNRRWSRPGRRMLATIWSTKNMIRRLTNERPVALFCDLHGHSRKYNIFIYGCANRRAPPRERMRPRIFPHLLFKASPSPYGFLSLTDSAVGNGKAPMIAVRAEKAKEEAALANGEDRLAGLELGPGGQWGRFAFSDCRFQVQAAKKGTGRIVGWRELGIANSFTLEASFCGAGDSSIINKRSRTVKRRRRAWRVGLGAPGPPELEDIALAAAQRPSVPGLGPTTSTPVGSGSRAVAAARDAAAQAGSSPPPMLLGASGALRSADGIGFRAEGAKEASPTARSSAGRSRKLHPLPPHSPIISAERVHSREQSRGKSKRRSSMSSMGRRASESSAGTGRATDEEGAAVVPTRAVHRNSSITDDNDNDSVGGYQSDSEPDAADDADEADDGGASAAGATPVQCAPIASRRSSEEVNDKSDEDSADADSEEEDEAAFDEDDADNTGADGDVGDDEDTLETFVVPQGAEDGDGETGIFAGVGSVEDVENAEMLVAIASPSARRSSVASKASRTPHSSGRKAEAAAADNSDGGPTTPRLSLYSSESERSDGEQRRREAAARDTASTADAASEEEAATGAARPRLPTHFSPWDLEEQGRSLALCLIRFCNLAAPQAMAKLMAADESVDSAELSDILPESSSPMEGIHVEHVASAVDSGAETPDAGEDDGGNDLLDEIMLEVGDAPELDAASGGSDSDPSADNLAASELQHRSSFKKLVGSQTKTKKKRVRSTAKKTKGKGKSGKGGAKKGKSKASKSKAKTSTSDSFEYDSDPGMDSSEAERLEEDRREREAAEAAKEAKEKQAVAERKAREREQLWKGSRPLPWPRPQHDSGDDASSTPRSTSSRLGGSSSTGSLSRRRPGSAGRRGVSDFQRKPLQRRKIARQPLGNVSQVTMAPLGKSNSAFNLPVSLRWRQGVGYVASSNSPIGRDGEAVYFPPGVSDADIAAITRGLPGGSGSPVPGSPLRAPRPGDARASESGVMATSTGGRLAIVPRTFSASFGRNPEGPGNMVVPPSTAHASSMGGSATHRGRRRRQDRRRAPGASPMVANGGAGGAGGASMGWEDPSGGQRVRSAESSDGAGGPGSAESGGSGGPLGMPPGHEGMEQHPHPVLRVRVDHPVSHSAPTSPSRAYADELSPKFDYASAHLRTSQRAYRERERGASYDGRDAPVEYSPGGGLKPSEVSVLQPSTLVLDGDSSMQRLRSDRAQQREILGRSRGAGGARSSAEHRRGGAGSGGRRSRAPSTGSPASTPTTASGGGSRRSLVRQTNSFTFGSEKPGGGDVNHADALAAALGRGRVVGR